jgi:hypothetical protein
MSALSDPEKVDIFEVLFRTVSDVDVTVTAFSALPGISGIHSTNGKVSTESSIHD